MRSIPTEYIEVPEFLKMLNYSISLVKTPATNDNSSSTFKLEVSPGSLCLPTVRFTRCLMKNGRAAYKEFEDLNMDITTGLFDNLGRESKEILKISDAILFHSTHYPRLTKYITFRKELISWILEAQNLCRQMAKYTVTGKHAADSHLTRKSKIVLETKLSNRVKKLREIILKIEKGAPVILFQTTMATDPDVEIEHIHWFMEYITKDSPKEFKYEKPYVSTTNETQLLKLMQKSF